MTVDLSRAMTQSSENRLEAVLRNVRSDLRRRQLVAEVNSHAGLLSPDVPMSDRIARIQNLGERAHNGSAAESFLRIAVQAVAALVAIEEADEQRVAAGDDARGLHDGLGGAA